MSHKSLNSQMLVPPVAGDTRHRLCSKKKGSTESQPVRSKNQIREKTLVSLYLYLYVSRTVLSSKTSYQAGRVPNCLCKVGRSKVMLHVFYYERLTFDPVSSQ